jgi:uncharacterized protein YbcI
MMATESQTLQSKVAQTLQDFWEFYTGFRPGRATVVIDQQSIAVLLEEVLAPAEQQMARTETGRLTLKKFEECILQQTSSHLQQLVAEAVGQDVILVQFHLDVATGNVLVFFRRSVGANLKSIGFKEGKTKDPPGQLTRVKTH